MVAFTVRDFAVNTAIATIERNEAVLKLRRADRAMLRNQQVICITFANNLWQRYRKATATLATPPSFSEWLHGKTLEQTYDDHFTDAGLNKMLGNFFTRASHPGHNPFEEIGALPKLAWLNQGCQTTVNAKKGDEPYVGIILTKSAIADRATFLFSVTSFLFSVTSFATGHNAKALP